MKQANLTLLFCQLEASQHLSLTGFCSSVHVNCRNTADMSFPTHSTSIAAVKGLAISSSLLTAGSLATVSLISLPSILHAASTSHTTAAQQFARAYSTGKAFQVPTEMLATALFGFLAWHTRSQGTSLAADGGKWKIYAGAATAMFSIIPFTIALMEEGSQKLVRLARASEKRGAKSQPEIKVSQEPSLSVPNLNPGGGPTPLMTPSEEFEPFEDSPFSTQEYETGKTLKLLQRWNTLNAVRTMGPLVAGGLGLWAVLFE